MDAMREKLPPRDEAKGGAGAFGLEASGIEASEAPSVTAARSPVRCPYCHDACGPEDPRAVVCQQCLSRHHQGCWREGGGRCASCSSTRALQPASRAIVVAPAEVELLRRGLPRPAVERLMSRVGVSEAEATAALLEAASHTLARTAAGSPVVGALVRVVAILAVMIFLIVAVIVG